MRIIDRLPFGVEHCSVLAHKGSDDWFVETNTVTPGLDPVTFVSATAVREMVRLAGLPTEEKYAEVVANNDLLEIVIADLEEEVKSLREFEQAATYSLEHLGSKVRKKPGRKPANEQPVAA